MLKLHIGVFDVPYVKRESPKRMAARIAKNAKKPLAKPKHASADNRTTGDVATILEAKYGLFTAFFENKELEIAAALEGGLKDSLESLLTGAPTSLDPFGDGTAKIDEMFKDFLSTREAERVGIPGTPTKAARRGVNHRFKHPYAKDNPRRPSFIDTALMQSSEKSYVEET